MPYRLPVAATIAEAFRFLTGRFTDWFPAALVPLTVWIALEFAIDRGWLAGLTFGLGSDAPMIAYMLLNAPSILAYLVIAVLLLLYAVALHRRALGMDRDASVRAGLVWRARHWRYVGQGVVVVAIVALGFIVSATFVPALGAVAGTAGVLESAAGQVTLTVIVLMLFAVPVALLALGLARKDEDDEIGILDDTELDQERLQRLLESDSCLVRMPLAVASSEHDARTNRRHCRARRQSAPSAVYHGWRSAPLRSRLAS